MSESNNTHAVKHGKNTAQEVLEESMKVSDDTGSLATIRDILFGHQAKEIEQKRQDLHQDFQHGLNSLKQETHSQFEQISADIQTLYRLLNDESDQRQVEKGETHQRIDSIKASLDDSNAKHLTAQDSLQLKIRSESERLEQQTRQMNDEISTKLEIAAKELKSDKTDRSDLAKMLRGVAEQLLDEKKS